MKPELRERLIGILFRSGACEPYFKEVEFVIAAVEADAVAGAKATIEDMTESLRLRHEQIAALTARVRELEVDRDDMYKATKLLQRGYKHRGGGIWEKDGERILQNEWEPKD